MSTMSSRKLQPLTVGHLTDFEKRLDQRFTNLDERLSSTARTLTQNMDALRVSMRNDMTDLLAAHHKSLAEAISTLVLNGKVKTLEQEIITLKRRVALLEKSPADA